MKRIALVMSLCAVALACKKETPAETPRGDQRPVEVKSPGNAPRADLPLRPPGPGELARPPQTPPMPIEPEEKPVETPEPDLAKPVNLATPEGLVHALWAAGKKKDVNLFKSIALAPEDCDKIVAPERLARAKEEVGRLVERFTKAVEKGVPDLKWKGWKVGQERQLGAKEGFKVDTVGIGKTRIYAEKDGKPERLRIRAMVKIDGKWKIASL